MEAKNNDLSAQESLDLISSMIHLAKGNLKKSVFHFLLWGWVIMLANLGMFALIRAEYSRPYIVWLITIPAWVASMYYMYRNKREDQVVTHIGRVMMWLWISCGISIFTVVAFGKTINWNLNPLILLITAVPTFITGVVIRFKPVVMGGISMWLFAIVCFLVDLEFQYLVGALALTTGYLIPGYMLKKSEV